MSGRFWLTGLFAFGLGLLLCSSSVIAEEERETGSQTEERGATRSATEFRVPRIEMREAQFDDVLDSLREASQSADPEGVGVNIVYQGPDTDDLPQITISLRNVSLKDAIRYITEAAGLSYRIERNAVIITSRDAPRGEVVTRIYPVNPAFMDIVRQRREEDPPRHDIFRW